MAEFTKLIIIFHMRLATSFLPNYYSTFMGKHPWMLFIITTHSFDRFSANPVHQVLTMC